MTIAEKKTEILKLIEKLYPDSKRPKHSLPDTLAVTKKVENYQRSSEDAFVKGFGEDSLGDYLARRRQELLELSKQRDKIGLDLLEERLLKISQQLEERIFRIEKLLEHHVSDGTNSTDESSSMSSELDTNVSDELSQAVPDIPDIKGLIPSAEPVHHLSGKIEEGILADILQLLSTNKNTGIFIVEQDEKRVELFFRQGNLYHAKANNLAGQDAFFLAMTFRTGRFYFDENEKIPEEKTIDGNTQFLVLEALRQIDEQSK